MGGSLINPHIAQSLLSFDIPFMNSGIDTPAEAALSVIMVTYLVASLINFRIPETGARYPHQARNPIKLITDFSHCFMTLWRDKLGQISLAVTTLFWGAGATLQFIVLKWAEKALHMPLDQAAALQGVTAIGIALGATAAAHFIPLKKSLNVMPLGVLMGIIVTSMTLIHSVWFAYPLLIIIGALAGFYVVPMNALLQHRGHVLMSAGHSIAVQNFNEQACILALGGLYAAASAMGLSAFNAIVCFGVIVAGNMWLIQRWHQSNCKHHAQEVERLLDIARQDPSH